MARDVKTLTLFLEIGKVFHLDGFVIEIRFDQFQSELTSRGNHHGNTIENFGDTVRRVLTTFSDADPHKSNCMRKSYIDKFGWY